MPTPTPCSLPVPIQDMFASFTVRAPRAVDVKHASIQQDGTTWDQ